MKTDTTELVPQKIISPSSINRNIYIVEEPFIHIGVKT